LNTLGGFPHSTEGGACACSSVLNSPRVFSIRSGRHGRGHPSIPGVVTGHFPSTCCLGRGDATSTAKRLPDSIRRARAAARLALERRNVEPALSQLARVLRSNRFRRRPTSPPTPRPDYAPPSAGSTTQVALLRSYPCPWRISGSSAAECRRLRSDSRTRSITRWDTRQRTFILDAHPRTTAAPRTAPPGRNHIVHRSTPTIAPRKYIQEHQRRRDNKSFAHMAYTSRITNKSATPTTVASTLATITSVAVEDRRFIPREGGQST
jgi:hypothetical protein